MAHSFIIRFAFCTLLLFSSTNLFAQIAPAPDPANQPVLINLDTMAVTGLTKSDFREFITRQDDTLIFEKGDKKITIQYMALYDLSPIVQDTVICNIQASYDRKFEKEGPTKEELTPLIVKQITERVNKLLSLKNLPLARTINNHREEFNRYSALITEMKKQQDVLVRKSGGFSPQAAEELKSKLWTQNLDLQSQIEGNRIMIVGLQKEIERLMKIQNDRRESGEYSTKLENLKRTLQEYTIAIESAKTAPADEKSLAEETEKIRKQRESVERQIAELEEKIFLRNLPNEFVEMQKRLADLHTKLTEARNTYKNPRHPTILNLEQQVIAVDKEAEQLKSKLLSAAQTEASFDDLSVIPALRAKLSETRIATDVLNVKSQQISRALDTVSSSADYSFEIENKGNTIKEYQRALDLLSSSIFDKRMKLTELERQSFGLVPLK